MVHGVVDEGRVHHDIAMVGQKDVGGARFELFHAGIGHAVGRSINGVVDIHLDFILQRRHRGDAGELTAQPMSYKRFERPAKGTGKTREAEMDEDI